MAGTLFVVATPIGHLDDVSARALRTLRDVGLIAAEDTRRTGRLLKHFGIATPVVSLHQHNEGLRSASILARLESGQDVALVSDAGTPGIADPGSTLVREARQAGFRVEPIPGPSAVAAAISIAGLEDSRFAFLGFPPTRLKDRKSWFEDLVSIRRQAAVVFFEAPHRIRQTTEELANYVESPILVTRELTKLHEEVLHGTPASLVAELHRKALGEYTIVVPRAAQEKVAMTDLTDDEIRRLFGQTTENEPISRAEAVRQLADRLGLTRKRVYNATRADR